MSSSRRKRKSKRSLRTILTIWFVLFSIVPLGFVSWYSVTKYEKAIDNELGQRLIGNSREFRIVLSELQAKLEQERDRYLLEPSLAYHLSVSDLTSLREFASSWLSEEKSKSITFFNRNGRMLSSFFKDEKNSTREFAPDVSGALFISQQNLLQIKERKEFLFVEHQPNQKLSLILLTKVSGKGGRVVGYLEQMITLDQHFLQQLREKLKLEIILVKSNGLTTIASKPSLLGIKKEFFQDKIKSTVLPVFFDLKIGSDPYGFIFSSAQWGGSDFFVALGASKGEALAVLKNVTLAFYLVVGAVAVLLLITIIFATKAVVKPINDLLEAIQDMQSSDQAVEIPIRSATEIGLLTESFNEMSRNVSRARAELKSKISELENANQELVETQARLVHSSKMVSLGQLVAGVAHELNNPIGFIYSNMSHLSEYSDKLIHLSKVAVENPEKLPDLMKQYDIDYIQKDLPKLISSCEDGARRTRDIVLGLRNFSRLEEAKLKEIDLHEAIDNTLTLLTGEMKGRIQIHRQYGQLPLVTCYASQINQVIMNLLSNACQAIEGNGNIWISTRIETKGFSVPMVALSIQDSGHGMSPQVIEKIFDPFFSTKGVGQGTGLGLSISYGIIQNHGGQIVVKSQLGTGTEFIIYFPVKFVPK